MEVKLKDVMANPFRDMDAYPINPQKIEALKVSIKDTEFWDNIVARKVGSKVEIAYGHHRLTALRELYSEDHKINVVERTLTDEKMLQIMAHENMEEWGHVSDIERETIRAVVNAFAEDKIALRKPDKKTPQNQLRYAPEFCMGVCAAKTAAHPYTADTVANFLSWDIRKVKQTLQAICLISDKHLKESQLKGLSGNQAYAVVTETNRAVKQATLFERDAAQHALTATPAGAKEIVNHAEQRAKAIVSSTAHAVSNTIKNNGSVAQAKEAGQAARVRVSPKDKELPDIDIAARRLAAKIRVMFDNTHSDGIKIGELIKFKKHVSEASRNELRVACETASEHLKGYMAKLK